MHYKVNEVFTTIQGEGTFTGTPAVFVRLQGCDVGCGFCDTKHTWDDKEESFIVSKELVLAKTAEQSEQVKQLWGNLTLAEIMQYINAQDKVQLVVITGGEPCLQDIAPLVDAIIESGRIAQIETSGTEPVKVSGNAFVTVSPKIQIGNMKEIVLQAIERANEIKFVCGALSHLEKLETILPYIKNNTRIYLQPLSALPKATDVCVSEAIRRGWFVSIQTHKYINIR